MPALRVGGRKFLMSPADLVLPLLCGVFLHVACICCLLTVAWVAQFDCKHDGKILLLAFLFVSASIHLCIVLTDLAVIILSYRLSLAEGMSTPLSRLLMAGYTLDWLELAACIWGLVLIFAVDWRCLRRDTNATSNRLLISLIFTVAFNVACVCMTQGCVHCSSRKDSSVRSTFKPVPDAVSKSTPLLSSECYGRVCTRHNEEETELKIDSVAQKLKWLCCACYWEKRLWNRGHVDSAFNDMASLFNMLSSTTIPVSRWNEMTVGNTAIVGSDDAAVRSSDGRLLTVDIVPSEILIGLYLLRMLQKHYGNKHVPHILPLVEGGIDDDSVSGRQSQSSSLLLADTSSVTETVPLLEPETAMNVEETGSSVLLNDANEDDSVTVTTEPSEMLKRANGEAQVLKDKSAKAKQRQELADKIENGFQPHLSDTEVERIAMGKYYLKYAVASYGVLLYLMENPVCACWHGIPCCVPSALANTELEGVSCCDGLSSIKVFLARSGLSDTAAEDVLFASQLSGLYCCCFFVTVDRSTKSVVISIRGTLSIPDSLTDANCFPEQMYPEIHSDCFGHKGILQSTRALFKLLNRLEVLQSFLRRNEDYGIVVCGHSLGAAVSVMLAMFMKFDTANANYDNRKRRVECYAFAPPLCINARFARRLNSGRAVLSSLKTADTTDTEEKLDILEEEKELIDARDFINCFIWDKDFICRLQWLALMKMRSSVLRLLSSCERSAFWVLRNGMAVDRQSICDALAAKCPYAAAANGSTVNMATASGKAAMRGPMRGTRLSTVAEDCDDLEDDLEENEKSDSGLRKGVSELRVDSAFQRFRRDVANDVRSMGHANVNAFGCSLWSTRFEHVGMVFHMCKSKRKGAAKKKHPFCAFVGSQLCNCLKCRAICLVDDRSDDFRYLVYRADTGGFQDILVSSRMAADHMPHVYKQVMDAIDLQQLQ